MPARTETRAIVAAACALGLLAAGIALAQAPRWPDADDIERARKAHPFPQADRLGAQPVPAGKPTPSRKPIVSVPNRCPRRRA